jgi:hypothetical protein
MSLHPSRICQGLLQSWIEAVEEKDLDKFNQTFSDINAYFRLAHYRWNHRERLGDSLCQQVYYRVVTPNAKLLTKYQIGTDTVYGEIIANIPDVMIRDGCLTEKSHFVDMGSGIGNMVCLMAIRTGCSSFGVEIMAHPASLAQQFAQQSMLRAQACGLQIGKMQLAQADMLNSELVKKHILAADVVLVNNRIFSPESKYFLDDVFDLTNCRQSKSFNRPPPEWPQRWCKGVHIDAIDLQSPYG